MTVDELLNAKSVVEIDDIHFADAILSETRGMYKELRMLRIAQRLATLREYYVKIGASLNATP